LLYGGYSYIEAVIRFEKLSNKIDIIISEPQSKSLESMEEALLAVAAKLKIPLSHNDIEITVRDTDKKGLGEIFIARPNIEAESKLLIVSFSYPVKILGIARDFTYNIEKVFTSKTSLVIPYDEELMQ
jgi:hypothetical protein